MEHFRVEQDKEHSARKHVTPRLHFGVCHDIKILRSRKIHPALQGRHGMLSVFLLAIGKE